MRQIKPFADERQLASCVYCGGDTETRDHVPSKVLLDKPYPENLPVVPACTRCNSSFSGDEEYIACLLECVLCGSTDSYDIKRKRIRRTLEHSPALAAQLAEAKLEDQGTVGFAIQETRVNNVMLKLARGHAAFELNEPQLSAPDIFNVLPMLLLSPEQRAAFESPPAINVWPELGSRSWWRTFEQFKEHYPPIDHPQCSGKEGERANSNSTHTESSLAVVASWINVQKGRYRFLAHVGGAVTIRIVLSEYLACEAIWRM